MLTELFMNHSQAAFIAILLGVVLVGVIFSRRRPRKERPDPPSIFGPIRGMFVCYQCDTVFNTALCPRCHEEAMIPLIQLTGSVIQNERLTAMLDRLQMRGTFKLPTSRGGEKHAPTPASRPEAVNGGVYEVH